MEWELEVEVVEGVPVVEDDLLASKHKQEDECAYSVYTLRKSKGQEVESYLHRLAMRFMVIIKPVRVMTLWMYLIRMTKFVIANRNTVVNIT